MLTLASKTIGNALAGVIGFAWPIFLALASMPYIVHKLGNEAYGVLALVTSVLGFFAFLDLGVTNASVKYIAEAHARNDINEINKIIGSSLVVYLAAGTCGAVIIATMTNTLVQNILKIPVAYRVESTFAFYLAACGFSLNMVLGVFAAIPKAVQRYDVATAVNIAITTLLTAMTLLILYFGGGLKEVVLLNFCSSLLSLAVYLVVAKKLLRDISFRLCCDMAMLMKLFKFGAFTLLVMISSAVLFQMDRLLIGSFVGSAAVTFYAVPASVATRIHSVIAHLMGVVFPLGSELHSLGRKDKLRELYLKASKYALIFSISLAVPLIVLSSKIMRYWMGPEYGVTSGKILALLALSSLFSAQTIVPSCILDGMGKPRANALFAVLSAISNIILCLLLIPRFGVVGAAFANISNILLVALYLVIVDRKILRIGAGRILNEIWLRPSLAAIVQAVLAYLLVPVVGSVASLILVLFVSVFAYYLLAYVFRVFNEEDTTLFKDYVRLKTKGLLPL
jgi:O-antigen/teichoic acid export membrane protein